MTYLYHISFPHDRWLSKGVFYTLWALETAQTALLTHDAFTSFVRSFGFTPEMDEVQDAWIAGPVIDATVACVVQWYYGYRLGALSRSFLLQGAVSLMSSIQCIAGVVWGVQALTIQRLSEVTSRELISTTIWLAGSALCDILIAGCVGYYLLLKGPAYRKPKHLLIALVRIVMESGILTALLATVELVLFFTFPHTPYHACLTFILTKIYSNSLLVMFNSQIRIVGARNWEPDTDTSGDAQNEVICDTLSHVRGGDPGSETPMRIRLGSRETRDNVSDDGGHGGDGWNDVIRLDHKVSSGSNIAMEPL